MRILKKETEMENDAKKLLELICNLSVNDLKNLAFAIQNHAVELQSEVENELKDEPTNFSKIYNPLTKEAAKRQYGYKKVSMDDALPPERIRVFLYPTERFHLPCIGSYLPKSCFLDNENDGFMCYFGPMAESQAFYFKEYFSHWQLPECDD